MTVYVCNTKVQHDRKFTESRKSQHNIAIKCPHISSNLKIRTCYRFHTKCIQYFISIFEGLYTI